ncbi:MAG: VWA domain-containing protein [Bryobacterales bacterium]|nr:VWA domain-containing protein [Bryobacterales bacterium]
MVPLLLLLAPGSQGASQVSTASSGPEPESYRISVDVDLVVLHATVRDRNGHLIPGLREEHFKVYEDGVLQSIRLFRNEDIPVTVGLVVDHSGSMRPKLSHVAAAIRTFVQASNPEDEMFVVNFNEHVTLGLPGPIRFTNRSSDIESAVLNAPVTGRTALYDAVAEALQHLQAGSREKKALVVISDGGDNASAHNLDQVLRMAGQSSSLVYTIGVFDPHDPDRNPRVLRRLARAAGGEALFPEEIGEVVGLCERVARDLRHQYTLGYLSTGATKPGVYRNIRVDARAKGMGRLVVRTRAGYITGGMPRPANNEEVP